MSTSDPHLRDPLEPLERPGLASSPEAGPMSHAPGESVVSVVVDVPQEGNAGQANVADQAADDKEPGSEESVAAWRVAAWSCVRRWVKSAPPWLVSLVFHTLLLIVLGLLFLDPAGSSLVTLETIFSDQVGDQFEDEMVDVAVDGPELDEPIITPRDLLVVEHPLATPPNVDVVLDGVTTANDLEVPTLGRAFDGRDAGMKSVLLTLYGGNAATEAAVAKGLKWLARNQHGSGVWSLAGPYRDGARTENKVAATAMALLAFQGAGHTPLEGEYKKVVDKGWRVLWPMQNREGNFVHGGINHHRLYSQAIVTIAICELYGMTRASEYRDPAQRAIDYAVRIQDREGGWRYVPRHGSDTSVTGWFVMALESGSMAGLEVPSTTLSRVSGWLDKVATAGGSQYSYRPGRPATPVMTAEGLLCRQFLGWKRNDRRLLDGVDHLSSFPVDWKDQNFYYWYYATQVMHHMEGEPWERWNEVMRDVIPAHQVRGGNERGSWSPGNSAWGRSAGRLYTTCLALYCLEVYYRHLPLYSRPDRQGDL